MMIKVLYSATLVFTIILVGTTTSCTDTSAHPPEPHGEKDLPASYSYDLA